MSKITVIYYDGIKVVHIINELQDISSLINEINEQCIKHNFPLPTIEFNEWE